MKVKLSEEESLYFNKIFNILDKKNLGYIDAKSAAIFMKKSNLSQEILKSIWNNSSQSKKNGLTRDEFFIALRLIALAQNNFPFTKREIENNAPIPPLPSFPYFNDNEQDNNIDDDESVYEIPEYNINLYKKFFENNKDSNENYISSKRAIELWKSESTSDFTIKRVANSLKPLEKIGYLNLKEFLVANHLLSICNCHEIPIPLPNCLLKFLGRPLNKNKSKPREKNSYKNFNDYLNKINKNINNNNLFELNNDNAINNNDDDKEYNKKNNEFHNRLSDINDIEYQNVKSEEIGKNEIIKKTKDINKENNDNNNLLKKDIEIHKDIIDYDNHEDNLDINVSNNVNNTSIDAENNIKLSKFKISHNTNNKQNNTKIKNDLYLENILKRMEELEIKNKENSTQISLLIINLNNIQKEQNLINKEMAELKDEFKKIKSKNNNFKTQKSKIFNNKLTSISLNDVFLDEIKKEKNNFLLNENQPHSNFNQALNNDFKRVQKKNIIKRDNKTYTKKYFPNTTSYEQNFFKNKAKLIKEKSNTSKNIRLDKQDNCSQNENDNNEK